MGQGLAAYAYLLDLVCRAVRVWMPPWDADLACAAINLNMTPDDLLQLLDGRAALANELAYFSALEPCSTHFYRPADSGEGGADMCDWPVKVAGLV